MGNATVAYLEQPVGRKPNNSRDRIDLRIDPKVRERIEKQAERFGQDLSAYIRQAIVKQLEADEATDPNSEDK